MQYIVTDRHQVWSDNDAPPRLKAKKRSSVSIAEDLFAALSDGLTITETVAGTTNTVAGNSTAVGDLNVKNVPVSGGYLESDPDLPFAIGLSQTKIEYPADQPDEKAITKVRKLNWILVIVIILVIIIFLRGLLLSDSSDANNPNNPNPQNPVGK
jgi:hypothetical protein